MIPNAMVVLRFGCATTSAKTSIAAGTSGIRIDFTDRSSGRREANRWAPQIANATFMISEGCTENPPMLNQRRAPCASVPIPGIRTSTSMISTTTNSGNEYCRSTLAGIRSAT